MARQESDRDDLFAELAALSPRIELRIAGSGQTVCAGRRESTGGWSLFFSPDRAYHFDSEGRLRRAFVDGFLYRSEGSTLSRLRRERSATETTLHRHDLSPAELDAFVDAMRAAVRHFSQQLAAGQVEVLRVMPAGEDVLGPLTTALDQAAGADPPLSAALRA